MIYNSQASFTPSQSDMEPILRSETQRARLTEKTIGLLLRLKKGKGDLPSAIHLDL